MRRKRDRTILQSRKAHWNHSAAVHATRGLSRIQGGLAILRGQVRTSVDTIAIGIAAEEMACHPIRAHTPCPRPRTAGRQPAARNVSTRADVACR